MRTTNSMFSVSNILENIPSEGSLEQNKLEKVLKLTKKLDKNKLEIAIEALCKLGLISEENDNKVRKLHKEEFIETRLRCSSKGYCFAIREDGEEDIYIRDQNLNHAWNGDRVLVKISREAVKRRSPEGVVKCILERSLKTVLCFIDRDEEGFLGVPLDDRVLTSIVLTEDDESHLEEQSENCLVEVIIDKYPIGQYSAEGHVHRKLTLNGGMEGDIEIVKAKVNLTNQDKPPKTVIKAPTSKVRKDFTDQQCLLFYGWDANNSPLLPAMYTEAHEGGMRVWIHSPSVAERLSIGNSLDLWLLNKANSHCLCSKWDNLLSEELYDSCKFVKGQTNEAITLTLDISANGEIKDWDFKLSTIKPSNSITSEQLKAIGDRKPRAKSIPNILKPIKDDIDQIKSIIHLSNLLNIKEKQFGSIELDLATPNLSSLGDTAKDYPGSVYTQWSTPLNDADANSIVKRIIKSADRALFLHLALLNLPIITLENELIDNNVLNDVARSAISLDLDLELDEDGEITALALSEAFSKTKSRRVLDKLLRHAIPQPKLNYSWKREQDDILIKEGIDLTAPWTCPSLHYHELINQYILTYLLKDGKQRENSKVRKKYDLGCKSAIENINWPIFDNIILNNLEKRVNRKIISKLNENLRKSKMLRSGLISIAQARSAELYVGKVVDAVISGVQSYGFFAELIPIMVEGLVHVSTLNDDWYEYRSRQSRLVGRKSKKIYQLGDPIKVKVLSVDILRNQIDLEHVETNDEIPIEDEKTTGEKSGESKIEE